MKALKKLIKYFFVLIFIIIICFFIFYFISNFISNLKGKNNYTNIFTIVSPSMKPAINVYDVVVELKVNEDSLKVGDIITFNSDMVDDLTVTHRIIRIEKEYDKIYYVTKGDNNTLEDPYLIEYSDIIGKVYFKIPLLGKFQFFASSKLGWSIIVLIPCIIILFVELFRLIKAYNIRKRLNNINNINENLDIVKIDKKVRELQEKTNKIEEN